MALGIAAAFMTSAVEMWIGASRTGNIEMVQGRLRYDLFKGVERLKQDLRLTDQSKIIYYPAEGANFSAISFPLSNKDQNGFFSFSNSALAWNQTVAYHVFPCEGKSELRRTVLNGFTPDPIARRTQLDTTVLTGTAEDAVTQTIFSAHDVSLDIRSPDSTFDGYAPETAVTAQTAFGTVLLSAGKHRIKFQATSKNASSSGYEMGFDTLTLTPSGGTQEADSLKISSSSGDTAQSENHSRWSGNYHLNYNSNVTGDFIEFETNYDQWLESNFAHMTHSNTIAAGTNPVVTISSRENQGLTPAWLASNQVDTLEPGIVSNQNTSNASIRSIISGSAVTRSATMIRLKVTAGSSGDLTISSACFGPRDGSSGNFISEPTPLFFDNEPLLEGDADPVGAVGIGLNSSITIPAGYHAWTNWFEYPIDTTFPVSDFLTSFYISQGTMTAWSSNPASGVGSYEVLGNQTSSLTDWASLPGYNTSSGICAVTEMATWIASGTATSQIYDTKIPSPSYSQIAWRPVLPSGSSVSFKVRSSANADMSGAVPWINIATISNTPGPLAGIGTGRYVQFQAILQAVAPYTSLPSVDDVVITWPGQTALVEIGGQFTQAPGYGIFKVYLDDQEIIKSSVAVKLTATEQHRGKAYSDSLSLEVKPQNTGK